jgi:hypothetical protein
MKGCIILIGAGILFTLLGVISKIVVMTTGVLIGGIHPDAYLRFARTLLLIAIALSLVIKFKKE